MGWLRVVLAPALLLGVLWVVDLEGVGRQLRGADPGWITVALAFSVAANFVSAWRWRSLVHWLGHRAALSRVFSLYLCAFH